MPIHQGTQTIETQRLILRRAAVEDAQAMFDNWASDPEVVQYFTMAIEFRRYNKTALFLTKRAVIVELLGRFELPTSSLPRMRSTD